MPAVRNCPELSAYEQLLLGKLSVEEGERLLPDRQEVIARRLAALDRLAPFGQAMREKYPPPEDGLTDVEWMHQDHERRAEQIDMAARSRGSDE